MRKWQKKYKPRACLAFGSLINKEIDGSMDRWMDLWFAGWIALMDDSVNRCMKELTYAGLTHGSSVVKVLH